MIYTHTHTHTHTHIHTHKGIYLAIKRNALEIWVSSNEVDEPRACYTEWNKSKKEKQILYTNTYTWNLEKWCWWTYLQSKNSDADAENRLVATEWEGEGGANWERSTDIYRLLCVKQTAPGKLLESTGSSVQCSAMTEMGGREAPVGGMYVYL